MKKELSGFTLVELLAVIVVLAIIMIIAIPSVLNTVESTKKKTFIEYVEKINNLGEEYYLKDQTLDFSSRCIVYDIEKDLGLSNTGNYHGYVVVIENDDDVNYYLTLYDEQFMVYGIEINNNFDTDDLLDYVETAKTNLLSKENLAAVAGCADFTNKTDGTSESVTEEGVSSDPDENARKSTTTTTTIQTTENTTEKTSVTIYTIKTYNNYDEFTFPKTYTVNDLLDYLYNNHIEIGNQIASSTTSYVQLMSDMPDYLKVWLIAAHENYPSECPFTMDHINDSKYYVGGIRFFHAITDVTAGPKENTYNTYSKYSFEDKLIDGYAYNVSGSSGENQYCFVCLTPETEIEVEEEDEHGNKKRKKKKLKDLKVGDKVVSINPETGKLDVDTVTYVDYKDNKHHNEYDKWYFEDGTIIETVHRHRFYNIEKQAFTYMDEWSIGEHGYTIDNKVIKLIKHEHIEEDIQHCTLFTEKWNNYFANGMLSGNRNSSKINIK